MNEFTLDVTYVASPSDHVESLPENPPEPNTQFYSKSFPGNDIGAKARWAYRKYGLFRSARYPPYKPVFKSPLKEIFVVSVAFYLASTAGRGIKAETGKTLTSQFFEMCSLWFNQMIDPPSYYAQELYRPRKMAEAPQFLTRFETKNGILQRLNELTPSPYGVDEMSDKDLFAWCCATHKIPHVLTLGVIGKDQIDWNIDPRRIDFDLFCKRQRGKGAIGAEKFRFVSPNRFSNLQGVNFSLKQVIDHVQKKSLGKNMLVQRKLENHESIKNLAQHSLIAFRVITCIDEFGNVEVTDAMLRILVDLEPNWQRAVKDEEFAAPIDLATGKLGLLTGDSMETSHKRYRNHPITNAKVNGRILEHWQAIAAAAKRCHEAFSHRLMIGWDIALTPHGPIILEGNTKFDVMLLQRVQDRAAGYSRFGELLEFHLKKLLPAAAIHTT